MTPKTIEEAVALLRQMGLRKAFKPSIEPETGLVRLKTRREPEIIEGVMHGSEIVLWSRGAFHVWTGQSRKAKTVASRHGLSCRLWDGEAELVVPASLADAILPLFGAKVRRDLAPEHAVALKARLAEARKAAALRLNSQKNGGSDVERAGNGQEHGSAVPALQITDSAPRGPET